MNLNDALVMIGALTLLFSGASLYRWLMRRQWVGVDDLLTVEYRKRILSMNLIDELREREGWMLEICGDNPDFDNGPNCILNVFGDWVYEQTLKTPLDLGICRGWRNRRFDGDSLFDCLRAAKEARDQEDALNLASV